MVSATATLLAAFGLAVAFISPTNAAALQSRQTQIVASCNYAWSCDTEHGYRQQSDPSTAEDPRGRLRCTRGTNDPNSEGVGTSCYYENRGGDPATGESTIVLAAPGTNTGSCPLNAKRSTTEASCTTAATTSSSIASSTPVAIATSAAAPAATSATSSIATNTTVTYSWHCDTANGYVKQSDPEQRRLRCTRGAKKSPDGVGSSCYYTLPGGDPVTGEANSVLSSPGTNTAHCPTHAKRFVTRTECRAETSAE